MKRKHVNSIVSIEASVRTVSASATLDMEADNALCQFAMAAPEVFVLKESVSA